MTFDPDAYIAARLPKANGAFNPDTYIAAKLQGSPAATPGWESGLRGAAQGVSLGFADEITGGLAALKDAVVDNKDIVNAYRQHRDESRAAYHKAQEDNPWTYGLSEVAGGLLTPGVGAVGAAGKGALTAGKAIRQGAKLGAGMGALAGLGNSESNTALGDAGNALLGAGAGGVIGAGAAGLGEGAKFGVKKLKEFVDPTENIAKFFGAGTTELKTDPGVFKPNSKLLFDKGLSQGGKIEYEPLTKTFKQLLEGGNPNRLEMIERVPIAKQQVWQELDGLYKQADKALVKTGMKIAPVDFSRVVDDIAARYKVDKHAANATLDNMGHLEASINEDIANGVGLRALVRVRQELDSAIAPPKNRNTVFTEEQNFLKEVQKDAHFILEDHIEKYTSLFKTVQGDSTLAKAIDDNNKVYRALSVITKPLDRAQADERANYRFLGVRPADLFAGSVASAALSPFGAAGMAVAPAAAVANSYFRSAPGLIARANIGRKLGLGDPAKLPRTTGAVRSWLGQNIQSLPPPMQMTAQRILQSTGTTAEAGVRSILPMLDQLGVFQRSKYPSLVDNKLTDPADITRYRQDIKQRVDSATERAQLMDAVNKDGTVEPAYSLEEEMLQ